MFKLLLSSLLFVNVSLVALENSEVPQTNRMVADLDFIKKTFEYSYAPAEWKRELFAWDLQSQFQSAVNEIKKNKGNDLKQFHKSLIKFSKSTRDYHVSILFSSTEYASLPFDIRCRNGKYIVTEVKKGEKDQELPLEIGDEILKMDGIPIERVVAELQKELGEENQPVTDRALALEILTRRNGRLGHQVPQGFITIQAKKPHSGKVNTFQVKWNYKPERILTPFINPVMETIHAEPSRFFLEEKINQKSTIPYYEEMAAVFSDDGLPRDLLGSRKSVFSSLGKKKLGKLETENTAEEQISWVWNWFWRKKLPENSKKFFDARLIDLPSGKYAGFIRISSYSEEDPEKALEAFISCIDYFQDEADMLLIDQTNNPGGLILYMYALASVLTDRPLEMLKDRRLLTQSDVLQAIETIDYFQDGNFDIFGDETVFGFPLGEFFQNLFNEAHFILNQWEHGHLLTEPYPFYGMKFIKPHSKVNFTKPIFILVNEKDFSCADEFPALLQDNKRAIIVGTPTAGAGGMASSLSFTNLNGINKVTYTTSIAYRFDGKPLENLGVTPDIFFDFNNEMYDKDNISADFRKIYDILDTRTQSSTEGKRTPNLGR